MSDKEPNMMSSICSMCSYYIKYLDKNTTYCDKNTPNVFCRYIQKYGTF